MLSTPTGGRAGKRGFAEISSARASLASMRGVAHGAGGAGPASGHNSSSDGSSDGAAGTPAPKNALVEDPTGGRSRLPSPTKPPESTGLNANGQGHGHDELREGVPLALPVEQPPADPEQKKI